ncbi:MAG: peptidoglycan DD-metalloendopeptidase family protein [Candidatus Izemoplasmatales bacterium]
MKVYLDLWQANKIINYEAIAGHINGVWFKLVDGDNPKDPLFDEQFGKSLGIFPRGVYAFPKSEWSPIRNYDRIMALYPARDGELPFLLDMEKDNIKPPRQQADELHELLTRIDTALDRLSIIYTFRPWWEQNIAPAAPGWCWNHEFMLAQHLYAGGRSIKKLSDIEPWVVKLLGGISGGWAEMLPYGKVPHYMQVLGPRALNLKEITKDIDVIVERNSEVEDTMKMFYPVDEGVFTISQKFGENPQWYTQSKGHNGIDWATPVGSNVYCAMDGIVVVSEDRKEKTGYGRQIRIQCANGITLIYGHLTERLVKVDDIVTGKQLIGKTGGATSDPYSGYSTGPHLHFEIRLSSGAPQVPGGYAYGAIDPEPLLVSHDYGGEEAKPLYLVRTLISNLTVRAGAGRHASVLRNAGLGEFNVYEERTIGGEKFVRISKLLNEWINITYPEYVIVVLPSVPEEPIEFVKWIQMLSDWAKTQGFSAPELKHPIPGE